MIIKQNLWFLTLFSLVLVLGVYYVTMPNELIVNKEEEKEITEVIKTSENEYLVALELEKEEERKTKKIEFEDILNSSTATSNEKNNAYLEIKALNELNGEEELLKEKIKKEFSLDSFVKIAGDNIKIVLIKEKHDKTLANNIMRLIQKNYDIKKNISVKFS